MLSLSIIFAVLCGASAVPNITDKCQFTSDCRDFCRYTSVILDLLNSNGLLKFIPVFFHKMFILFQFAKFSDNFWTLMSRTNVC